MADLTRITRSSHFHMGHRVPSHEGKCRMPHGHTYHLEVKVEGHLVAAEGDPEQDMVIDFGRIDDIINNVVKKAFDHRFMVWNKDPLYAVLKSVELPDPDLEDAGEGFLPYGSTVPVTYIPTAEAIARHIFLILKGPIDQLAGVNERREHRAWLYSVELWETPRSSAEVRRDHFPG